MRMFSLHSLSRVARSAQYVYIENTTSLLDNIYIYIVCVVCWIIYFYLYVYIVTIENLKENACMYTVNTPLFSEVHVRMENQ